MKLFKYRKINDHSIAMVRDGIIWFANAHTLNDPFECDFSIDDEFYKRLISDDFAKNQHDCPGNLINYANDIVSQYRENLRNSLYLCSFSSKAHDIVMCSHYCDEHKGMIIELEIPDHTDSCFETIASKYQFEKDPTTQTIFHNIDYNSQSCVLTLNEKDSKNLWMSSRKKAKQWEYENEVRLIIVDEKIKKEGIGIQFPKSIIKSVSFCSRVSRETINAVVNSVNRENFNFNKLLMKHGSYSLFPMPV